MKHQETGKYACHAMSWDVLFCPTSSQKIYNNDIQFTMMSDKQKTLVLPFEKRHVLICYFFLKKDLKWWVDYQNWCSLDRLFVALLNRVNMLWKVQCGLPAIISRQPDKTSTCWKRCNRKCRLVDFWNAEDNKQNLSAKIQINVSPQHTSERFGEVSVGGLLDGTSLHFLVESHQYQVKVGLSLLTTKRCKTTRWQNKYKKMQNNHRDMKTITHKDITATKRRKKTTGWTHSCP